MKGGIIGRIFKLPHVSCFDFSGVVVAVGDMVTNFKVGEKVYGDNAPKVRLSILKNVTPTFVD